ncbi:hypothetical protein [Azotobacter salinestris]|uniref:hypothetical protein n=1 Tax=Azotobacter salinestris TaxID=69964 RepID=UPI0032DECF48
MRILVVSAVGLLVAVGGIYLHEQSRQASRELHERFAASMVARHDGLIWNAQMARACDQEFDGRPGDEGIRRYLACEERMLDPAELRKALALDAWFKSCSSIQDLDLLANCFARAVDLSAAEQENAQSMVSMPKRKNP